MSQLKRATSFLVRSSPQDEQSLLRFAKVSRFLMDKGVVNVGLSRAVDLFFLVLVQHHVTHVLNVVEVLLLEALQQL